MGGDIAVIGALGVDRVRHWHWQ